MAPAQPDRRRFTADLTPEAHARLQAFVTDEGAGDMVAFLETLCMHLGDRQPRRWLLDVVVPEARQLKAQRGRRPKS